MRDLALMFFVFVAGAICSMGWKYADGASLAKGNTYSAQTTFVKNNVPAQSSMRATQTGQRTMTRSGEKVASNKGIPVLVAEDVYQATESAKVSGSTKHYLQANAHVRIQFWRQAAEQGDAEAMWLLGCCSEHGIEVSESADEAFKWYRRGAEKGNAIAENDVGICYLYGKGVPKDEAEAVMWLRKSAQAGRPSAQYNLGCCYDQGHGVAKDQIQAATWWRKAAAQGYVPAQNMLNLRKLSY